MRKIFTKKELTDSGLALLLILLLMGIFLKILVAYKIALVVILILMLKPQVCYPFTFVWLNLSDFLGKISSKILLSIIFLIFVVPMGIFRRLIGIDALKLKKFRKSNGSTFIERNHKFSKDDMIHPY